MKRLTLHHQQWFLLISLIPAVLAVIGHFVAIPFMGEHGFWMAIIAYVVLAVGILPRAGQSTTVLAPATAKTKP